MWQRRDFIKMAGIGFLASLAPRQAAALAVSELVLASAVQRFDGNFAVALLTEQGQHIANIDLPGRGHDVTECPETNRLVVFARRPGTFAVVFDQQGNTIDTLLSPAGRHFYGHGVFSLDGKLLYATENNFEAATGVIGVYDATNGFRRVGEFGSGGVGPHDVLLSKDGRYLCVANGGIETHPDYGREKLNLATMQPNIVWIECESGDVVATHTLPPDLNKLSLRHLAVGPDESFWFGSQYQGEKSASVPLLGRVGRDVPLTFVNMNENVRGRFANYIGSVGSSTDGRQVIVTSPVGNVAAIFDVDTDAVEILEEGNVCGVDWGRHGPVLSTGDGALITRKTVEHQTNLKFDNHLLVTS